MDDEHIEICSVFRMRSKLSIMKNHFIVLFFTILFNIQLNNANGVGYDRDYYHFASPLKGTWYQALQHCNSLGKDLVSIRDDLENADLYALMKQYLGKWGGTYRFWTSGTTMANNEWIWMRDGSPIYFGDKLEAGSGLAANETCLQAIYTYDDNRLQFNTGNLNEEHFVLCERKSPHKLDLEQSCNPTKTRSAIRRINA
ncbi:uncharacterized protein LOC126892598 [Diabrotica virgifera virgifera]|uniref:C-type lectin domain-containing protein n=2 Tax=Diabrotica virgifera virgifera TaxID=50390 RepID=A0ABM5L6R4_DIAVI|nr:uncharacterized protein LOC126892598 [Diabrotica virgifera virgifera]